MADCTTHFAHWSVWIQTVSNEFTLVINVTKTSPKTCNIENANWVTLHNLIHINRLSWPTHLVDCQTLQLGHCRMTLHKGGHVHINGGILPAIHDLLLGYISGFFTQHGRVKPWICIIRCILKKKQKIWAQLVVKNMVIYHLVGGFNPSEKYARQIGSFPQFSGWK